jgi:hypothetical protein
MNSTVVAFPSAREGIGHGVLEVIRMDALAPSTSPDHFLPLTMLLPELQQIAPELLAKFTYRRIYSHVIDGKIVPPIERRNGRWGCRRQRLPELISGLRQLAQGAI